MKAGDTSTPVVILRLDHHGALGIVRSLGRLRIPVYGVHSDRASPAFRSRYCRQGFVWDLDHAAAGRSVDFLGEVARRIGRKPVLLPSNDESALFVAENSAALQQHFLFPQNPDGLPRSLVDKWAMCRLARKLGIPTAETVFPASRIDVSRFAETATFPVVLKASDGIRVAQRAHRTIVIARSREELLNSYEQMADPGRADLMLQEYIPGGDDSVWMFNGYFDEASDCLFGMTGRKIHQYPVHAGITSLGVCMHNEIVYRTTCLFMKAAGYRGILDIGYRYDARDGTYKVLDVNPRIGATFRLFTGGDGMDVARAMYLDMTGQPVPASAAIEGRKWIVEDLDVISCVRYYRDGLLGFREWLRSLRGVQEGAWFAGDDLIPFLHMWLKFFARPFNHATKLPGPDSVVDLPRNAATGE